jgi:hypothetical protein
MREKESKASEQNMAGKAQLGAKEDFLFAFPFFRK